MSLSKLGTVTNTQHHAHPLVLCDSLATYGGVATHESEILDGNAAIALGELAACIADGGQHGHVDVFARGDGGFVLANAEREDADVEAFALQPFEPVLRVGRVDVPSGSLAIGIAYNPLDGAATTTEELLVVAVTARAFEVSATEGGDGWRIRLEPVS